MIIPLHAEELGKHVCSAVTRGLGLGINALYCPQPATFVDTDGRCVLCEEHAQRILLSNANFSSGRVV